MRVDLPEQLLRKVLQLAVMMPLVLLHRRGHQVRVVKADLLRTIRRTPVPMWRMLSQTVLLRVAKPVRQLRTNLRLPVLCLIRTIRRW
jgi:hypothetical protein